MIGRVSLRIKVTVLLVALSVGPLIVNGLVNTFRAVGHGKRTARDHYSQAVNLTADRVDALFDWIAVDLTSLGTLLPFEGLNPDTMRRRLEARDGVFSDMRGWEPGRHFTELNPNYAATLYALADGTVFLVHGRLATAATGTSPHLRDLARSYVATGPEGAKRFERLLESGGTALGEMRPLTAANEPRPFIVRPIRDWRGRRVGYLGVVLDDNALGRIVSQAASSIEQTGEHGIGRPRTMHPFASVARAGTYATHTDPARVGRPVENWLVPIAARPGTGDDFANEAGVEYVVSRQSVGKTGWYVVIGAPTAMAYRGIYAVLWLYTIVILLTFLFVLLFADHVASVLTGPIKDLERGAEMIGSGALDYRIELMEHRDDELGHLADAFNEMGDNLLESRSEIESYGRNLEVINQELDAMVHALAHDLKKHLRGIEAFANFLDEDYGGGLDDEGRDLIQSIIKNVHRINTLADNLIGLVEQEREHSESIRFDVSLVMLEARERALERHRGEVAVIGRMPELVGDRVRLLLAFFNLMTNGLKFNRSPHPKVEVTVSDLGAYWQFELQDNGIGIEPRYHEQVFELFHRLNHGDEFEGTGSGLNLVRRVLQEHRGDVHVRSELGKGAIFAVTLPKEHTFITSPGIDLADLEA